MLIRRTRVSNGPRCVSFVITTSSSPLRQTGDDERESGDSKKMLSHDQPFADLNATGVSPSNSLTWNQDMARVGQQRPDEGAHVIPYTALLRPGANKGMWLTVGARVVLVCDMFLWSRKGKRSEGSRNLIEISATTHGKGRHRRDRVRAPFRRHSTICRCDRQHTSADSQRYFNGNQGITALIVGNLLDIWTTATTTITP